MIPLFIVGITQYWENFVPEMKFQIHKVKLSTLESQCVSFMRGMPNILWFDTDGVYICDASYTWGMLMIYPYVEGMTDQ